MNDLNNMEFQYNGLLKRQIFVGALRAYNLIDESEALAGFQSARVLAFVSLFDKFNDTWLEEQKFRDWLGRACQMYLKIGMSGIQEKVTMSVTRNYGAVSVTFGLEQTVFAVHDEARRMVVHALTTHVHDLHREYAVKHLNKSGALPPAPPANGGADVKPNEEEIQVSELVVVKDGKKVYFKVKGGRYTEFGVKVWPEVLRDAGLDAMALDGSISLSGRAIVKLKDDGKPEKVVKLILNE